jgi:predicted metalloendopeptidase
MKQNCIGSGGRVRVTVVVMKRAITFVAVALSLACTTAPAPKAPVSVVRDPTAFDRANMDPKAKACDDFYEYTNGGWLATHDIPPEYTAYGVGTIVGEDNRRVLHEILEAAAAKPAEQRTPNEQKIGDFWTSCMDEAAADRAGITPLQPELDRINTIAGPADLNAEFAHLQQNGSGTPLPLRSRQDAKKSTEVIASLGVGGLGLPDRDYYFKNDDATKKIRDEYTKHVTATFHLLGDDDATAAKNAEAVMRIENALAQATITRVARRDPNATYHRMTVAELAASAPNIDWTAYVSSAKLTGSDPINVSQPKFVEEVNKQIASTPLDDWKAYLRWHLVNQYATTLSAPFVTEDFHYHGTVLNGQQEMQPRWKRCVARADQVLGEALGQAYVERKFPPEAKRRMTELVGNLIGALHANLETLDWMSDATRKQAIAKLEAFNRKIGYPDQWRDYSALTITPSSFTANVTASNRFELNRDLDQIGKPVDRGEWGMTPPTYNAYYNPLMNEIVFPAGMLQFPMFDLRQDDAFNYGAIGSVIGHEMSHGFDDSGSQFNAEGNLVNWWTPEDKKKFDAKAECIVRQFDSYYIEPGLHHNGKLVAGESIADLGGAVIAWEAWQRSLQGKPKPPVIDGFTPEQRFFLGFARARASNTRIEALRLRINTDPHPANKFRVNGPLSNMPQFASAFQCKAGDSMVRADRCQIW